MNSNKTVHSIIAGVGALTLALTAATAFAQTQSAPPVVWSMNPQVLAQQSPVALVRPTELEHPGGRGTGMMSSSMGTVAMGAKMKEIVRYAYNVGMDLRNRIIVPAEFEAPSYDFMDTMPHGGKEALQQALKDQFGLMAKRETRETDVLLLTVKNPDAPKLKVNTNGEFGGGGRVGVGTMNASNVSAANLAANLENLLCVPVVDQTGLNARYDYELKYAKGASADQIKQGILDQLGLELTVSPQKQPMEFLVVEKVK